MGRIPSIALLVVGIVLLVWAVQADDSAFSSVSKVFTGSPTNKTIWLYIGGILLSIGGLNSVQRAPKN